MKFLLDTHIVIWWWKDDPELPPSINQVLEEAVEGSEPLGVSTISLWEIAMLVSRGQLQLLGSLDTLLADIESHSMIRLLPINACVAAESTRLGPAYPRDPVDRIIGATARCYGLRLITVDRNIRNSGVVALA